MTNRDLYLYSGLVYYLWQWLLVAGVVEAGNADFFLKILFEPVWNISGTFIILLGFLISFIWEWAETKLWNRSTFIYNWWHLNCLLGNWRTNRWWSTSRRKIYISRKKTLFFYLNGLFSGERPKLKTCSEFFENPGGSWLFWGIDFSSVWFWLWGFTVEVEDVWIISIKTGNLRTDWTYLYFVIIDSDTVWEYTC